MTTVTPPAMADKGTQSWQYKCFQNHYASLTGLLNNNAGTKRNLTDPLTAKGWLVPGSSATPNDLINLVLERIKYNATECYDFIAMLQQSGGAKHIVDDLLGAAY